MVARVDARPINYGKVRLSIKYTSTVFLYIPNYMMFSIFYVKFINTINNNILFILLLVNLWLIK